jgi:recombinational DNA repair protein (RecF pathway)
MFLREMGYGPALENCAVCNSVVDGSVLGFSAAAGGVVCSRCQRSQRDCRQLSTSCWRALRELREPGEAWRQPWEPAVREELRQVLGHYVTYLHGRRPRLLPYLGS